MCVIVCPACLVAYTPANIWSKQSNLPGGELQTQKIKSCLWRVGWLQSLRPEEIYLVFLLVILNNSVQIKIQIKTKSPTCESGTEISPGTIFEKYYIFFSLLCTAHHCFWCSHGHKGEPKQIRYKAETLPCSTSLESRIMQEEKKNNFKNIETNGDVFPDVSKIIASWTEPEVNSTFFFFFHFS